MQTWRGRTEVGLTSSVTVENGAPAGGDKKAGDVTTKTEPAGLTREEAGDLIRGAVDSALGAFAKIYNKDAASTRKALEEIRGARGRATKDADDVDNDDQEDANINKRPSPASLKDLEARMERKSARIAESSRELGRLEALLDDEERDEIEEQIGQEASIDDRLKACRIATRMKTRAAEAADKKAGDGKSGETPKRERGAKPGQTADPPTSAGGNSEGWPKTYWEFEGLGREARAKFILSSPQAAEHIERLRHRRHQDSR